MIVFSKDSESFGLTALVMIILIITSISYQITCLGNVLTLKSGKKVEGQIIEKTDEYIKIDFSGIPLTYYMDQIENIGPSRSKLKDALDENSTGAKLIKIYNSHLEAIYRGNWPEIKKFLSAGRIRELEQISHQTGGLMGILRILRDISPRNIKNIKENISFDRVTLTGIGQNINGELVETSINFTNKYGQWKIGAVISQRIDLVE